MLLTVTLAGCAIRTPLNASSACNVWKDVSWSPKDTDQTIREVKENNARRTGYCEGVK
jgi:hypothetical protein